MDQEGALPQTQRYMLLAIGSYGAATSSVQQVGMGACHTQLWTQQPCTV
jgi:hypothetical protein